MHKCDYCGDPITRNDVPIWYPQPSKVFMFHDRWCEAGWLRDA